MCGTGSSCSCYIWTWGQTGCGSHYFWLGMEAKLTAPEAIFVLAGKEVVALGILGLMLLPALVSQRAFADGLFQESIGGSIQGRDVQLFVKVNPPILTTQTEQDRFLQL